MYFYHRCYNKLLFILLDDRNLAWLQKERGFGVLNPRPGKRNKMYKILFMLTNEVICSNICAV
jgi:hypothetical protein